MTRDLNYWKDAPGQSGSYRDYERDVEEGRRLCGEQGHREPRYNNGKYLFCSRCGLREWPDDVTSHLDKEVSA